MKKDCIFIVKDSRGEDLDYYEFVSKNGIYYELLEGVTVGAKQKSTSAMIFIMLNTFNENMDIDDELMELMGGCSIRFIDFFCSSIINDEFNSPFHTNNQAVKEDEAYIRKVVNDFEKENKELIEFIKEHHIPTSCKEIN